MTAVVGSLMKAQDHLRTMLANCSAFQTWLGVANATAALAKIHHEALPPPASSAEQYTPAALATHRPFAIVWTDEENGYTRSSLAAGAFDASGRLAVKLEQAVPSAVAGDPGEADLRFKNSIGQIIDGLCGMVDTAGYLSFKRLTVDVGPYRSHPDEVPTQGDWQAVELGIDWSGL